MALHRCQSHQSASARGGSRRRQSGDGQDKRGLNTKIHLAVDAHGLPLRILVTEGPRADCRQALPLIAGLRADYLVADRGYDTDAIVNQAQAQGMEPVIPPRKHRKIQRPYDEYLYRLRHLVENAILRLKGWRSIATRYAKRASSFLAIVQIRCLFLWLSVS
ncbi:MAG: IS5 family transposase [Chthoniobacteraceae bacterium]